MLHPLVAVWLLIAIALIFALPRKKAITPFLLAFFTIPIQQVVLLGAVHFTALRLLILAGLVRVAFSRGSSKERVFPGKFNRVDQAVVLWTVSALIILSIQWMDSQALIKNLGDFLDAFGGYLVVRFLIIDSAAIRRAVKALAVVCVIQGAGMVNEQITHVNVFGLIGGFPLAVTVRDGHIRSQGVMGCLYAGVFAGALIPLFIWLWTEGKERVVAGAGLAGAMAIVIASILEHVVAGFCQQSRGACLLASAQANAPRSLGIRAHPGGLAPGDARSGVVADCPHGPDRILFGLPPLLSGRQPDPAFRRLVASWLQELQRLGMGHVGYLQPVC